MGQMSKDEINVGLFDEVKRLKQEVSEHIEFEKRLVNTLFSEMAIPKNLLQSSSSSYKHEEERLEIMRKYLMG
jgi:hypothetical protein